MQSILALSLALFAAFATAVPTASPLTVTIQLANDLTGASVDAVIPINSEKIPINYTFGKLADPAGNILASSALLNAFPQVNFDCEIVNQDGITLGDLTLDKTSVDLDGNLNEVILKNLSDGFVVCE
jgi:hypothetical protein